VRSLHQGVRAGRAASRPRRCLLCDRSCAVHRLRRVRRYLRPCSGQAATRQRCRSADPGWTSRCALLRMWCAVPKHSARAGGYLPLLLAPSGRARRAEAAGM